MKHALTIAALLLAGHFAHAKAVCNISTSSSKDMTFDQSLFSSKITSSNYVLIGDGAETAQEVYPSSFDTSEKLEAIDGKTLVIFTRQQGGYISMAVVRVDISRPENVFSTDATVFGQLAYRRPLNLTLPLKSLSLTCDLRK